MHGEGEQILDFPQLQISIDVANNILSGSGFSLAGCQTKIDESKTPNSFITENEVEIKVQTEYEKFAKTMNIVGLLEGSDPVLKERIFNHRSSS